MNKLDECYNLLEISKETPMDNIKKQYRKLSLKYHPDKNIDNEEWAEKMFKEFENMKAEHYENENKEEHKKKKIF